MGSGLGQPDELTSWKMSKLSMEGRDVLQRQRKFSEVFLQLSVKEIRRGFFFFVLFVKLGAMTRKDP